MKGQIPVNKEAGDEEVLLPHTPTAIFRGVDFFYAIGSNSPIYITKHVATTQDMSNDGITALVLACGDMHDVLFTIVCEDGWVYREIYS